MYKRQEPHLFTDELIEEYRSMIKEGVEQEIAWGHYVIGDDISGLNCQMITDYIRYLGNLRCMNLGFEPLYPGYEKEPDSMSWISQYSNANLIKTDLDVYKRQILCIEETMNNAMKYVCRKLEQEYPFVIMCSLNQVHDYITQ